ncbi:MAG: glycosyltransferase family 9 protein, partial [Betaproteobacteria bacterium]
APVRYLDVDPMRVTPWQHLLGARTKPRIGLAWAGNPAHVRDRFRSMALESFVPLLVLRDFEWIGLQKGAASDQIATLPPGCGILDMGRHSETFADLAALIELLDVVITVDTSVVHVAGALGKPTLLLLDAAHDWRWPRSGTHARWYPSVQIVRQPSRGDWTGAIELAAEALRRNGPELSPATFSSRKSRAPCP